MFNGFLVIFCCLSLFRVSAKAWLIDWPATGADADPTGAFARAFGFVFNETVPNEAVKCAAMLSIYLTIAVASLM